VTTINSVTPSLTQVGSDTTLEITGTGFLTTTTARLLSPEDPPVEYPLAGFSLITSEIMRAQVPANSIPIGFYSVLVDNGGEDIAQIDNAFRISVDLPTRPFQTNNTTDIIQARIMDRIGFAPNGLPYDKRKGQVPWDMTAAQAPEFERIYKRLDDLFPQGFAQFMGGALLDLRAEEHGILRNPASFSKTVMQITAAVGTVIPSTITFSTTAVPNTTDRPIVYNSIETASVVQRDPIAGLVTSSTQSSLTDTGKTWAVDEWKNYYVLLTLGKGTGQWRKVINNTANTLSVIDWDVGAAPDTTSTYRLFTGVAVQAAAAGRSGNVLAGAINRLATPVAFVTAVSNPVAADGGVNRESDRLFLSRFLLTVRQRSAGGNDTDYQIWARETDGTSLGAVSVLPEWNGYGTVKVVIVNSDNSIPNAATVSKVYDYIQTRRPIGAHVTVEAAVAAGVDARFTLTVEEGFSLASVQDEVKQAIRAFLNSQPVGGDEGFVLFYRVQQAALEDVKGIDTFDMYTSGYGIRRSGASTFSTNNVTVTGTEKPIAGTITAV
jgi:uncharacterized phage protein gp47/JayE